MVPIKNIRFITLVVAGLVLLGSSVWGVHAQDVAPGAFARSGFDARGMAMANAVAADLSGDISPYYNPALAPFVTGQHLSASAAFMSMDRELQFLQFATPIQPSAGAALGLIHGAVNNIDGRDTNGFHTGDLSTEEFALFLAFGNQFGRRIAAGATLKLYQADYLDTVDPVVTFGLDLGALVHITEPLNVSLVVSDLLANYEWNTSNAFADGRQTTDRFPVRIRLGGAYALQGGRARIVAEYESRLTSREHRTRVPVLRGGSPRETFETESVLVHGSRARIGAVVHLVDAFVVRAGLGRIGVDDGAGLRPSAGFGVREQLGNLNLRAGYAVVLEPYVRDGMHLLTLKLFL